jgi:arylsulfatase A-like enzyme
MFKNLVIVSIDSLRADGINYNRDLIYGREKHETISTPNLDLFAEKGTSFINSYSTNTYTTSSHASLFTGSFPPEHKVRAFFDFNQKLESKSKTIAEELNDQKFQTFFYSDVQELFSAMDIWRGFKIKTYADTNWLWNSIEELKKDRNFIFIHTFDVHEPYLFIEDKAENKEINEDYYSAITDLRKKLGIKSKLNQEKKPNDSWREIRMKTVKENVNEFNMLKPYYEKGIEKFDKLRFPKIINKLEELGFNTSNTLFIFLSDHGEGRCWFENDNYFLHGGELTQEVIQNFNLFSTPFQKTKSLISIADIYNTSLSLLGLKKSESISSIDIYHNKREKLYIEQFTANKAPYMKDFTSNEKNFYMNLKEIKTFVNQRGIVEKDYKMIFQGKPEFESRSDFEINQLPLDTFVSKAYNSFLRREPEKKGLKKYVNFIKKGKISRRRLFEEIVSSPEFKKNGFFNLYKIDEFKDKKISEQEAIRFLISNFLIEQNDDFVFDLFNKKQKRGKEVSDLKNEIIYLKGALNMIESSKFFKMWKFYNKTKKILKLNKKYE